MKLAAIPFFRTAVVGGALLLLPGLSGASDRRIGKTHCETALVVGKTQDAGEFREAEAAAFYDGTIELKKIKRLAQALITANPSRDSRSEEFDFTTLQIKKASWAHPRFQAYTVIYQTISGNSRSLSFRTNGRAAFLDETWSDSVGGNGKDVFYFSYEKGDGSVGYMDQADFVIKTLPNENVRLARSMSEEELLLWRSGDLDSIQSKIFSGGRGFESAPRTYFALNDYQFPYMEPVIFSIPKSVLEELNDSNQVTVNTYNSALDKGDRDRNGMTEVSRTSFGLEVEIVVEGNQGRQKIQKYMAQPTIVPRELYKNVRNGRFREVPKVDVVKKILTKSIERDSVVGLSIQIDSRPEVRVQAATTWLAQSAEQRRSDLLLLKAYLIGLRRAFPKSILPPISVYDADGNQIAGTGSDGYLWVN